MFDKKTLSNHERGLTIIEILIVIAIVTTAFVGMLQLTSYGARSEGSAKDTVAAYLLARQTLEAARFVRDDSWATFSSLSIGATYYPVQSGGKWTLSASNPGAIDGFTPSLVLNQVYRDANHNIVSSGGSLDAGTLNVVASVEWTARGGAARTVTLETYLANIQ
ncbi:MAG: hypothetical protein HYV65_00970 [Candidatus Spechtbacteria bacterium]|nr:hypothetical protein [Candidatus Spechtbacteria bacterium]